jgi:hypothetical protein
MIKRWSTFNESSDKSKEIISSKFLEVRDLFIEFEDMGIVSYTMVSPGFERGGYLSFNPKVGDVNRFLDFQLPVLISTSEIGTKSRKLDKVCIIVEYKVKRRKR